MVHAASATGVPGFLQSTGLFLTPELANCLNEIRTAYNLFEKASDLHEFYDNPSAHQDAFFFEENLGEMMVECFDQFEQL